MHYEASIKYMSSDRTGFGGTDHGAVQSVRRQFNDVNPQDLKMVVYQVTNNDKHVIFVGTVEKYIQSIS